jgi:hypothetical protein
MRLPVLIAFITLGAIGTAAAQTPPTPRADMACQPGAGGSPPTIGKDSDKPLSDQLAQSNGVICPPAGVDPEMPQSPPQGGVMKVVPPPGSPGGNPNVQPK